MYAVLVNVKIARYDEAIKNLKDHLVPMIKSAPGFVSGTWFGNEQSGNSLLIFESEESARAMSRQVQSRPDDPVSIENVQVFEVHAEA